MQKNKKYFEIGERRVIWQEIAAKNVAQGVEAHTLDVKDMKEQIKKTVDYHKNLTDAEKKEFKIKIDGEHKDEHEKKIYWSLDERDKFTKELMKEKDTNMIAKLIHAEIQNELFETKMDAAATLEGDKNPDYEDSDHDNEQRDKNPTRDIIENAWADATKDLNDAQRKKLEESVLKLVKAAAKDEDHEIFKSVDREGFGFIDKMITGEEAVKISQFIKIEANKMEKKAENGASEQAPTNWQKEKEDAESVLKQKYNVDYDQNIKIEGIIANKVAEKCEKKEFQKTLTDLNKLGFELEANTVKETLQKISIAQGNLFKAKAFGDQFKNKTASFLDVLEKMPEENRARVPEKILAVRGIEKNNSQVLVEYIAFGNPQEDLKAAQNYFEADDALNNKEAVGKVDVQKVFEKKEADNENSGDIVAKTLESANGAMQTFGECFEAVKEGKWGEAFSKFLEAFGSLFKTFIDASAHLWNSLAVQIPDSALELPLIGSLLKEIKKKAKESNENKKKLDLAPITSALGIKPEEYSKAESLTITVEDFFKEKTDGMEKYAKDKSITLGANELETLKGKLKTKETEMTPEEKRGTVFNFLKKKIKDSPEYLQ